MELTRGVVVWHPSLGEGKFKAHYPGLKLCYVSFLKSWQNRHTHLVGTESLFVGPDWHPVKVRDDYRSLAKLTARGAGLASTAGRLDYRRY
jgi:hypothetical protein